MKYCDWFHYFKDDDFDVDDRSHQGRPKTFEDAELESLLERNHDWGTVSKSFDAIGPSTAKKSATIPAQTRKSDYTA